MFSQINPAAQTPLLSYLPFPHIISQYKSDLHIKLLHTSPSESSQTHLLFSTPKISKMMSSNIVQEKAKVTEKMTWTTYCRTCNGENKPELSGISVCRMAPWYPSGEERKKRTHGTTAHSFCYKVRCI